MESLQANIDLLKSEGVPSSLETLKVPREIIIGMKIFMHRMCIADYSMQERALAEHVYTYTICVYLYRSLAFCFVTSSTYSYNAVHNENMTTF